MRQAPLSGACVHRSRDGSTDTLPSTEVTKIVVYDRARKIHGYLQYLVKRGHEASNPFAQLCDRHGERSLAPILRAACAADPTKAFAALLKPPLWSSSLGPI